MVARIDGRCFTRLTKETYTFQAPFDSRFRDLMLATTEHLMTCGFKVLYGYSQSDEISLLFDRSEETFGRKTRKFNSILAGEASAKFSLLLGDLACFDCRISQLPAEQQVVDYFRWRQEDAHRNALNAHLYWCLRQDGWNATQATERAQGLSVAEKNELLFQYGTNFNDLPTWQKRGVGLYWQTYTKETLNPMTGETVQAQRRHIYQDLQLLMKEQYDGWIRQFL